jgi:penicillin-binding protein 1A
MGKRCLMVRKFLIGAAAVAAVLVLALVGWIVYAVQDLPDFETLAEYQPPITTRVHAGDGQLIAEFAQEQRVFVPIEAIPDVVKNAFLSAEDKGFYEHGGIDFGGLLRATVVNIGSIFTGDRMQGASTITQQVAKNMLLTSDRTVTRKVKEAFLAQRIEKAFSKDRILELYLNEIYLGQRAYGVAAATLNYFDKPLAKVTIAEAAYLASLPKAPNNYHPVRQKERALARRNWVIDRMAENGFISPEDAEKAKQDDLITTDRLQGDQYIVSAHFVEELRRRVLAMYGEKGAQQLYQEGLSIRSTLDTRMQVAAAAALRRGLDQYDRRHGWRGPLARINLSAEDAAALKVVPTSTTSTDGPIDWKALDPDFDKKLDKIDQPPGASGWLRAVVIAADSKLVTVVHEGATSERQGGRLRRAQLADDDVKWAVSTAKDKKAMALTPGAAIYVQELKSGRVGLRQIPEVEGAIMAMDANTGRVLAMVGGYSFGQSQFNRATQAKRQPGSAFKPFVYAAALDYGLTPATQVEDAPFQLKQADGTVWSPENYTKEFYGATTLRQGLEKSRNLMTIRLAYEMGMNTVFEYGTKLDVYTPESLPKCATAEDCRGFLSYALGAGETTLLRLVEGYAAFANGGKRVTPTLIDRIQDRTGKTTYKFDQRQCPGCAEDWQSQAPPVLADTREQILDPVTAYQVASMLEGAIQRGTGTSIKAFVSDKTIAGKTGTTNDYKDAWFVGFTPDLVVGVWVGFDKARSLGEGEAGGRLSAPIFGDFMREALKNTPDTPFRARGVRFVTVDYATGQRPSATTTATIEEAFRPGTEPQPGDVAFIFGKDKTMDVAAMGDLISGLMTSDVGSGDPAAPGAPPTPGVPGQPAPAAGTKPPNPQDEALGGIY